jgi:hypothetical protein
MKAHDWVDGEKLRALFHANLPVGMAETARVLEAGG